MRTAIGALLGLLMLGGCGTARTEALARQLDDLTQQLKRVRKIQAGTTVTVEDLETRLFLVQDALDTARKNRILADTGPRHMPIVHVRPMPGPETHFDPMADTRPAPRPEPALAGYDRLTDDGRVVRASPIQPAGSPAPPQAPIVKESQKPRLSDAERDAVRLYKESYALTKQKRYEAAIDGFRTFIERYPTHGYADNALYWMGECYYDRGLWMKALETFGQVIQSYPLGNKAPDAMLKLGLCHQQLRNFRQAREVLKQVTEIYPKNRVATIARQRLEQLP